jgi:hypothetical protein
LEDEEEREYLNFVKGKSISVKRLINTFLEMETTATKSFGTDKVTSQEHPLSPYIDLLGTDAKDRFVTDCKVRCLPIAIL